mmetsp:Transcript_31503/g.64000  ORF Transcript_31503/g.64000 Transcript_31503/m.64000 type:complete len:545 (+) Transcript_31503:265-1899(+)
MSKIGYLSLLSCQQSTKWHRTERSEKIYSRSGARAARKLLLMRWGGLGKRGHWFLTGLHSQAQVRRVRGPEVRRGIHVAYHHLFVLGLFVGPLGSAVALAQGERGLNVAGRLQRVYEVNEHAPNEPKQGQHQQPHPEHVSLVEHGDDQRRQPAQHHGGEQVQPRQLPLHTPRHQRGKEPAEGGVVPAIADADDGGEDPRHSGVERNEDEGDEEAEEEECRDEQARLNGVSKGDFLVQQRPKHHAQQHRRQVQANRAGHPVVVEDENGGRGKGACARLQKHLRHEEFRRFRVVVFELSEHVRQRKEAIHDEPPPFPQLPVCFARFVELERKDHGGATEHHGQSLCHDGEGDHSEVKRQPNHNGEDQQHQHPALLVQPRKSGDLYALLLRLKQLGQIAEDHDGEAEEGEGGDNSLQQHHGQPRVPAQEDHGQVGHHEHACAREAESVPLVGGVHHAARQRHADGGHQTANHGEHADDAAGLHAVHPALALVRVAAAALLLVPPSLVVLGRLAVVVQLVVVQFVLAAPCIQIREMDDCCNQKIEGYE